MKLTEVLNPIIERQKLMEGQGDRIIDETISSLRTMSEMESVSEETASLLRETISYISRQWEQYSTKLKEAGAPNTWKVFVAKGIIAGLIRNFTYTAPKDLETELGANRVRKLIKKTEIAKTNNLGATVNIFYIDRLVHFAGLDYEPIQNYNPLTTIEQGGNIDTVMDDLLELEEDYIQNQQEKERYIELTGDENWILEVGEYKWLDLNAWCDRAEGNAMRHCGNVPYGVTSDSVYTLNSIVTEDGKTYRKPHVFFVIEKGGILGERKGFANSKPTEEYHEAIVEFLKLPIVKYMKSDARHASDQDFQLEDLDESKIEELREVKGDMFVDMTLWGLSKDNIQAIRLFEKTDKLRPSLLHVKPYVKRNIERIKDAVRKHGNAEDAYFLAHNNYVSSEWAKEVIENLDGPRVNAAFLLWGDGKAELEWFMKVVENSVHDDTENEGRISSIIYSLLTHNKVSIEWVQKILESLEDSKLNVALRIYRSDYVGIEWVKKMVEEVARADDIHSDDDAFDREERRIFNTGQNDNPSRIAYTLMDTDRAVSVEWVKKIIELDVNNGYTAIDSRRHMARNMINKGYASQEWFDKHFGDNNQ